MFVEPLTILYPLSTYNNPAITILVCLIIDPASSQKATGSKATKVTKATYQKAALMSYPGSVEKGEGFKVFPSVGAKALFTKASKGRRQLFVSSKGMKGSVGVALSIPYIKKGKAGKGKSGKSSSLPPKEGLSIPEKEFRIFHHKHAKSGKESEAGLPSSSPSVSSVPNASPSDTPSSSSAPSHEPSMQPSVSSAPTAPSAKARKLENTPFPTEPEPNTPFPNTPFPTEPAPSPVSKTGKGDTKARKLDGTPYPTFLPSQAPVASKTSKERVFSLPNPTSNSAKARKLKGESESKSAKASSSDDYYRRGRVMY